MMGEPLRGLIGLALLFLATGVCAGSDSDDSGDAPPYDLSAPSYQTMFQGSFSTGLVLVDITGDDYPDMIITGANDMSPRPLAVYYNKYPHLKEVFNQYPNWYSNEAAYMNGLAVGDVNGDGWMDAVVSITWTRHRRAGTGSVWLFVNRGGELEQHPSYKAEMYGSIDCALGDIDADGDLDLVAGVYCPAEGLEPDAYADCVPQPAMMFLNQGGEFAKLPSWKSDTPLDAVKPVVADFNQDGWMDVAFTTEQPVIYYGRPKRRGRGIPVSTTAGWQSAIKHDFPYGADVGHAGKVGGEASEVPGGEPLMLAVSSGELDHTDRQNGFFVYQPPARKPMWKNQASETASKLLLADLNNDGYLDLVGDHWSPGREDGMPLWIFMGVGKTPAKGGPFGDAPTDKSRLKRVGEDLAVADLKLRGVKNLQHTFTATAAAAVLTLPQRHIIAVDHVERNGKTVSPKGYAWTTESNWISLAEPLAAGDKVIVSYRWSPVMDLAHAVWNPQHGDEIYFSQLKVEEEE